eukprot:scaffold537251_cov43-Prasinocladus_malaysianus.AAC.1
MADVAISRSLVAVLMTRHLNERRSREHMDSAGAANWLAGAFGAPVEELAQQLGINLDPADTANTRQPLSLQLSELIHCASATLREAERKEK